MTIFRIAPIIMTSKKCSSSICSAKTSNQDGSTRDEKPPNQTFGKFPEICRNAGMRFPYESRESRTKAREKRFRTDVFMKRKVFRKRRRKRKSERRFGLSYEKRRRPVFHDSDDARASVRDDVCEAETEREEDCFGERAEEENVRPEHVRKETNAKPTGSLPSEHAFESESDFRKRRRGVGGFCESRPARTAYCRRYLFFFFFRRRMETIFEVEFFRSRTNFSGKGGSYV